MLPRLSGVATPVTTPERAARWCVALISRPTAIRCGPACSADPIEPRLSASTTEAPPWSSPYGWVFPSTGIVPTTRSGLASTISMCMRAMSESGFMADRASTVSVWSVMASLR